LMREIKGEYRREDARLEMYYRFYKDTSYFDVRYRVNWEEKHAVLKLECETDNAVHVAAVPAGEIRREACSTDVPLGAWVRAGEMTLIPNAAFAYSALDGCLAVTLLRSPIYGDLRIGEIDLDTDYDIIDRGIVEGGMRVSFGGDAWRSAEAFCNPPTVIVESNHRGELAPSGSFYSLDSSQAELMALKYPEDGEGVVARVRETSGTSHTVTLKAGEREYPLSLLPYEIKTVRLCDDVLRETNMLED